MHVKFERALINNVPLIDFNAKFSFDLELNMLKVKVKGKDRNGKCSSMCIFT